jgi:hypothetical protein
MRACSAPPPSAAICGAARLVAGIQSVRQGDKTRWREAWLENGAAQLAVRVHAVLDWPRLPISRINSISWYRPLLTAAAVNAGWHPQSTLCAQLEWRHDSPHR